MSEGGSAEHIDGEAADGGQAGGRARGTIDVRNGSGMIETRDVTDRAGLEEAWRIRFEVFVDEQHVPPEEEVDARDEDPATLHALAFLDGVPVATGRVLPDGTPGHVHVGRVAVRAAARGSGVGASIMAHLEGMALAEYGIPGDAETLGDAETPGDAGTSGEPRHLTVRIALSAQESAVGFYSRLGYSPVSGERYLDAGIWHQDMARTVAV